MLITPTNRRTALSTHDGGLFAKDRDRHSLIKTAAQIVCQIAELLLGEVVLPRVYHALLDGSIPGHPWAQQDDIVRPVHPAVGEPSSQAPTVNGSLFLLSDAALYRFLWVLSVIIHAAPVGPHAQLTTGLAGWCCCCRGVGR